MELLVDTAHRVAVVLVDRPAESSFRETQLCGQFLERVRSLQRPRRQPLVDVEPTRHGRVDR